MPSTSKTLSRADFAAGLLLLAGLWWFAREPLWHTDLWAHLSYGRYYSEHAAFPETEPFLPLAEDRPFRSSSWLWQWGAFHLHTWGGNAALQLLYATSIIGSAAVVYVLLRRKSLGATAPLITTGLYLAVEWQQILVIRPQHAALVCFPLLLLALTDRKPRWWCVLVMIAWANLHGSFVIGLIAPGMILAGEALDLWQNTGRLRRVFQSPRVRRTIALLTAMTAATVLNPYGPKLLIEILSFTDHPNLKTLIEWKPIYETPKQGTVLLVVTIVTVLLMITSRVAWRWRRWLPVLAFGVLSLRSSRFVVWLGPLLAIALCPYVEDCLRRCLRFSPVRAIRDAIRQPLPGARTVLFVLALVVLVMTPMGGVLFRGVPGSPENSYGYRTPLGAGDFLTKHPPAGLILNNMEWGDWLIWSSHGTLQPMVASHVTYLPAAVWNDYFTLSDAKPEWREAFARYPFTAALLDRSRQAELIEHLQIIEHWREVYRDKRAVILVNEPE